MKYSMYSLRSRLFYKDSVSKDKYQDISTIISKINNVFSNLSSNYLDDIEGKKYTLFSSVNLDLIDFLKSSKKIESLFSFLNMLRSIKMSSNWDIQYDLRLSFNKIFVVDSVHFFSEDVKVFSLYLDEVKDSILLYKSQDDYHKIEIPKLFFSKSSTLFSIVNCDKKYIDSYISPDVRFFIYFLNLILKRTKMSFVDKSINYVSPLRAHPKRYYFLDRANHNKSLDTLDGDALAEILKSNYLLRGQVNDWFKKFGITFEVSIMKDIIHQLVVKQNSLSLDITDVGFGISQVLPVIVQGFLSFPNSLTLIEQPEIHLHPTMQADLADLFISIVFERFMLERKCLLIETHSEYFLKRLQRRISEGKIKSSDVAIYFINPQSKEQGAEINKIEIQSKGYFEWRKDFYSGELLNDTLVFLKNQ